MAHARHAKAARRCLAALLISGAAVALLSVGSSASAATTLIENTDPAVTYDPGWSTVSGASFTGGSISITTQAYSSATLSLTVPPGETATVSLIARTEDPYCSGCLYSVDGGSAVTFSQKATPTADQVSVFTTGALPAGPHQIVVYQPTSGPYLSVDAFAIVTSPIATTTTSEPPSTTSTTTAPTTTTTPPEPGPGSSEKVDDSGALALAALGSLSLGTLTGWAIFHRDR